MIFETLITVFPEDEKNTGFINKKIFDRLKKENKLPKNSSSKICATVLKKKSIDARKGKIKIHLRYCVYIDEFPKEHNSGEFIFKPKWKNVNQNEKTGQSKKLKTVLIIGSGPAGLFAAFKLLEYGIKPVILERGSKTSKRKIDIANISRQGVVNENSNYCFGEGGAGTFSDGKLYTRSNKRGNIDEILQIFVYHGASANILTESHAHIGSDKLPKIVNNMTATIRKFGGEVHFDTKVTDFILEKTSSKPLKILGVCAEKTLGSEPCKFYSDAVLLASGHSAIDIYTLLGNIEKRFGVTGILEQKTFAMGVRVEHPRQIIDKIQYHGKNNEIPLPSAEYRLVTQVEDRGVYSFCMCPGGNIVPSASFSKQIVVNGMSCSSRNSHWSNSAIVVEIRPEDIENINKKKTNDVMSSLEFRTQLEETSYLHGKGQKAPAQRLVDFIAGKESLELPASSYAPGLISSRLDLWLPDFIVRRLKKAFKDFDKNMHGFICNEAVLVAIESRTSTPVRIVRCHQNFESSVIEGLFPAGEGSGYAGGIVSSAMDGVNCVLKIAKAVDI
ncbi:MAG: NAD(P)/FAD-dependent oxidoreductase [Treponemataceae bacterium]